MNDNVRNTIIIAAFSLVIVSATATIVASSEEIKRVKRKKKTDEKYAEAIAKLKDVADQAETQWNDLMFNQIIKENDL